MNEPDEPYRCVWCGVIVDDGNADHSCDEGFEVLTVEVEAL